MKKKKSEEFIRVSIHLKVDGKIARSQQKTYYARGRETHCFTFNDFARVIFMWDQRFDGSSTYAMDGLMQKMAKKLPKKKNETAESVFQKYWVNLEKTINEDFIRINKGGKQKYLPFPEENDYLKYSIITICENFQRMPLPVKYGFLYWFYTYVMNNSIEEIKKDIENIPDSIKQIVESVLIHKKKK
jgi:hypothetical protein